MAERKIYQAFGLELTVEQAAKAAGVSKAAFYAQLSKLGGSMEMVLRLYEGRYGGVLARLEELKQDKEGEKEMNKSESYSAAAKDEAAKEQILSILFDADRAAKVPVEAVTEEPETVSAESETVPTVEPTGEPVAEQAEEPARLSAGWDSREWVRRKTQTPLAVEIEEVKPDRGALKLLNDAIESLEKLSESGWEMSVKVRRDATAMVEGWKNERLLHFKDLIDWRALEG